MAEMKHSATFRLIYEGRDITADVSPYLVTARYNDNTGKADELTVTLEDSERLWQNAWYPKKGARLTAEIETEYQGERSKLDCGVFEIDDISLAGPPDQVTLKAVSTLVTRAIKKETKSRGWDNVSLATLAGKIAVEHGLSCFVSASEDIVYQRVDQREESDLALLKRLCDAADLSLKISGEKLIVFAGKKLEQASPVARLQRGDSALSRFSFADKTSEIYQAAEISYQDSDTKQLYTYRFTPPGAAAVGEVLKINRRAKNLAEAKRKARAMLRKKNKMETTATYTVMGDTVLLAGLCVEVAGWGRFDGKYIIESASHSVDRSQGYTTNISLQKVLGW